MSDKNDDRRHERSWSIINKLKQALDDRQHWVLIHRSGKANLSVAKLLVWLTSKLATRGWTEAERQEALQGIFGDHVDFFNVPTRHRMLLCVTVVPKQLASAEDMERWLSKELDWKHELNGSDVLPILEDDNDLTVITMFLNSLTTGCPGGAQEAN